ncbi:MAG: FHA domain-containing protein [Myxococcota bacterium]
MSEEPNTTLIEDLDERSEAVPVLLSAQAGGKIVQLRKGTNLVGRGSSAFVRFDRDGVSRRHATIVVADDTSTIRDLGSTNGTFVDGEPIDEAPLRDGCVVRFGQVAEARFLMWRGASKKPPPDAHLTKRELQIARLVARGLGNEEVGCALGISRRTVSTHLSRVYARIGVSSRGELARLLTEWGLAD